MYRRQWRKGSSKFISASVKIRDYLLNSASRTVLVKPVTDPYLEIQEDRGGGEPYSVKKPLESKWSMHGQMFIGKII